MSPDLLVATGQAALALLAWTMLFKHNTFVQPVLSLLTAQSLGLVAIGLFLLSAPISGVLALICATAWLGIFTIRGRDPNLPR